MSLTLKQQFVEAIKKSNNILIAFKDIKYGNGYPAGGDAIASALALQKIIIKNNKTADIASPNFSLPKNLAFLPSANKITNTITSSKEAIISVNIKNSGLKDLSYKIDGDNVNIFLNPKSGNINLKNIKINNGALRYDLIIVLDTPDIALLGDLYTNNKALFDAVPIINIDHQPQNDGFGEINLLDIKSSSISEIVWNVIENSKNIDEEIISCLLTGIICKTKNFRQANTGTKTLETVSKMIKLGAKRQEIVEMMYRTKAIETLKLWGRTLARLKQNEGIICSILTRGDFIHSGAEENVLPDVIHELISNSPANNTVVIIFEAIDGKIKALMYSENKNIKIESLGVDHFSGQLAHLNLPYKNLIEAEKGLLEEIKNSI
ncbi:hypothetical protein L6259_03015 [Candidatus Parcubacteria bacterium]|nr:hypothetical protein [Patescibacteria group bacterium]MCG2694210.1 hypothetical protein [Candidatus Parcubacteria bacterium]